MSGDESQAVRAPRAENIQNLSRIIDMGVQINAGMMGATAKEAMAALLASLAWFMANHCKDGGDQMLAAEACADLTRLFMANRAAIATSRAAEDMQQRATTGEAGHA